MKCENCKRSHDGKYGSGRFCTKECARGFSTKAKRKEINEKVGAKIKQLRLEGKCQGKPWAFGYDERRWITKQKTDEERAKEHFWVLERKNINDNDIIQAAKKSISMLEASKSIDLEYKTFRFHAKRLNVFDPNPGLKGGYRDEEKIRQILAGEKTGRVTKQQLVGLNYKKDECELCGQGPEYNGQFLNLQLDHINGTHSDNSLDNLRILCPNCHTQTPTYCVSKSTIAKTNEEYIEAIKNSKNARQALISLGLTPKGGNYDRINYIKKEYNLEYAPVSQRQRKTA